VSEKRVLIADDCGAVAIFLRTALEDAGIAADVQWQKGAMKTYDIVLTPSDDYAAHITTVHPHLRAVTYGSKKKMTRTKFVAAIRKLRNAH
jgi:hypothetical protein